MEELPQKPDFFILVIIDKEFEAVKKLFSLKEPVLKKGRYYHPGIVTTKDGRKYSVVCHQSYDQGNMSAGIATTAVLNNFEPKFLLVVGIAGGIDGREKELSLGDVVVSTEVKYYELEKEIGGKILDRSIATANASLTLLNTYRIIKNREWGNEVPDTPPEKKENCPKAFSGIILSGEKLLADENSPRLKRLLEKYDRPLAVEMEGAGASRATYEESTHVETKFLDVRGISDFCNISGNQSTRDTWRTYASLSAATFAKKLIENTIIDPDEKSPHENYLRRLEQALPAPSKVQFNFKMKTDDVTFGSEFLHEYQKKFRKIWLRGQAGSGKTEAVRRMALEQINDGTVPIFLNLRSLGGYSKNLIEGKNLALKEKINILLKTSSVQHVIEHFESFERPYCFIMDGLNELFSGEQENPIPKLIVESVDDYVQAHEKASVIMTDRPSKRDFLVGWKEIQMLAIEKDEAKSVIDTKFGIGTYDKLSPATQQILGTAFFLNASLRRESPNLFSVGESMHDFLKDMTKLSEEELDVMSDFLFATSKTNPSLEFSLSPLKDRSSDISKKLESSGILRGNEGQLAFEHQLEHEYLFSRFLLNHRELWNGNSFDVVTLGSNSFEAINMTFEQIKDKEQADAFLLRVYDWNLSAVINAIKWNSKLKIDNFSMEIVGAITALACLKKFDRSYYTATSATESLESIDHQLIRDLVQAKKLEEILAITNKLDSSYPWFMVWKNLFEFDRSSNGVPDTQIDLIRANNSLLGWTAANVFRECKLTDRNQLQLRTIYYASDSGKISQNTRRWRVVHSLGTFPSEDNANLLFHALSESGHYWVRYGAARSLVEMAAITDDDLRKKILKKLSSTLKELDEGIWKEVRKTAFYKEALKNWDQEILPILKQMEREVHPQYKAEWSEYIKRFESGAWKTS